MINIFNRKSKLYCYSWPWMVLVSLSSLGLLINHLFLHFQGNNYFPPGSIFIGAALILMIFGVRLLTTQPHFLLYSLLAILQYYLVMVALALATNAVQLTPFPIVDHYIVAIYGNNVPAFVAWTNQFPHFKFILEICYFSLAYQVSFLPLIIIAAGQLEKIHRFCCLLLISAIIGFLIYYFFPTVAPAYTFKSPIFTPEQLSTGIKFMEIRHHQAPSTIEGGLTALPSFHTIWAWYCVDLLRGWPVAFCLLLVVNVLLMLACVLLGWHYPIDILASIIVIILSNFLYKKCMQNLGH